MNLRRNEPIKPNKMPAIDPDSRSMSVSRTSNWTQATSRTGLIRPSLLAGQHGTQTPRLSFRTVGLLTVAKQKIEHAPEEARRELYTPVQLEIQYPPKKLPYMGADARQIGKYKSISTETIAVKQNDVQQVKLEKTRQDINRGREKAKKEITRTLLMWHMELDRNVAKDPALERRTNRIVKFMDKVSNMTGPFHFTRSFYVDLADPEFDSITSPQPSSATPHPTREPAPNTHSFAPKSASSSPTPHPPPRTKLRNNTRSTRINTRPRPTPPPKQTPVKKPFSDCADANKISGYTHVKIYTDPYRQHLPPLSEASKRFDIRLARLPYKHVRNEKEWQNFLDVLNKPNEDPSPPKAPSPDFAAMHANKMDSFRKRLPVISVLPRWQNAGRGRAAERAAREAAERAAREDGEDAAEKVADDSTLTLKKENSFIGFNKDAR